MCVLVPRGHVSVSVSILCANQYTRLRTIARRAKLCQLKAKDDDCGSDMNRSVLDVNPNQRRGCACVIVMQDLDSRLSEYLERILSLEEQVDGKVELLPTTLSRVIPGESFVHLHRLGPSAYARVGFSQC